MLLNIPPYMKQPPSHKELLIPTCQSAVLRLRNPTSKDDENFIPVVILSNKHISKALTQNSHIRYHSNHHTYKPYIKIILNQTSSSQIMNNNWDASTFWMSQYILHTQRVRAESLQHSKWNLAVNFVENWSEIFFIIIRCYVKFKYSFLIPYIYSHFQITV